MDMKKKENLKGILIGGLIGLINGIFGAGGGMIAVPALERVYGFTPDKAHASAISVILPISVVSMLVYLINGVGDMHSLIYVAPAFLIGGFFGAKLLGKLSFNVINKLFAGLMLVAGGFMLFM
ncbi:MAG: sulfite exporter TauE/SafE family protein [Clostridia bacterium]|nr:sulfite exporter TauE/SafE family protein [Clostridia bacterium]